MAGTLEEFRPLPVSPSTKFHNGNVGTINYDLSDNYALDGQRLIVKNGLQESYGRSGTLYETENYSNIKVTSYGALSSNSDIGPDYFVVEYPDGSKAYYGYITGNSSNSRGAVHYAITYWENAQGLRISYSYFPHYDKKLNIATIKYGTKNETTPINEINFIYGNKFKQELQLIGGQQIRDDLLLTGINTKSSGVGFRNYAMTYDLSSLGYERLTTITEKTGDNSKSFNPTVFSYAENQSAYSPLMELTNTSLNYFSTESNAHTLTGDFDGDGENDLLIKKNGITLCKILDDYSVQNVSTASLSSLGLPTGEFPSGIINVLDKDLKIAKNQSFYSYDIINSNNYRYKIFNYNSNSNKIEFDYERTFHTDVVTEYKGENQNTGGVFSGDFNGDNLTDVIRVYNEVNGVSQVEFFNFDRRINSNFVTNIGALNVGVKTFKLVPDVSNGLAVITGSSVFQKGDINGDGKMDLILFRGAPYNDIRVYTLINNSLVEIINWRHDLPGDVGSSFFQQHTAGINTTIAGTGIQRFPIVIGDYNGDGKSDILFVALKKVLIATGGKYFVEEFLPDSFPAPEYPYSVSYMPVDSNNDGKSDIVRLEPKTNVYEQKYLSLEPDGLGGSHYVEKSRYYYDNGIKIDSYYRPGVNSTSWNKFGFDKFLSTYQNDTDPSDDNAFNYALLANVKKKNPLKTELVLMGAFDNTGAVRTSVFSCNNYVSDQHLIKSITIGNGVKEVLTYSPLKSGNGVYEAGSPQLYPNLSIQFSPEFKVVSQIDYPNNRQTKMLFKYFSGIMNVEGLGFMGFQANMRTNIHNDSSVPVVSTVSKNDFLLRGANVENYSAVGLALPSAQTPTTFISKSTLGYNSSTDALQSNKVFKLKNTSSIQFDGLTNTSTETTTDFDSYNNPLKVTTLVKDETSLTVQKTVTDVAYQDPMATPYIVGRPKSKIKTVSYNGDVATNDEVYWYNSQQLLSQVQKRTDATTNYVTEDNTYDLYGNITSKKITAGSNSRMASWAYDTSGRFLTSKTDIESLPTTFTYYPNGTLKTETNPYGQTSKYEYDLWFRKSKMTDYLQKTIIYGYEIDSRNNRSILTAVSSDGTATSDGYDELGRKINEGVKANVNGVFFTKDYTYDVYNRVVAEGVPYRPIPIRQSQTVYDVYGRVIQQISPTDLRANITYSGLTSTIDDGSKTKKITKDAIGNVIEVIDTPGGTIKYSYYANGNLKETDLDGIKTKILQDKWGRKIQLDDPSAGTYKYAYNDFNELIKEENNNGITTYKLSALGKLEEKTILGTNTNSKTTYTYNSLKQISGSEFVDTMNGGTTISNTYFYDNLNRNYKTIESTPYASFTKTLAYDSFGRIDTETSAATAGGKTSSKTLKRTYQNGSPYQILDGTAVLWQTDVISDNGALAGGTFGNGIKVSNTYDGYGYSTSKECKLGTTSLMKLETSFDIKKGNLASRKTSLFDYPEEFKYDSLDRLTDIITLGQFLSNTFSTSDVEGYQGENVAGLSSSGGALSVQVSNAGGALKKTLLTGAKLGDAITLTFDLRKILGSDAYNVYIQEQDPVSLATVKYLKATFISASTTYTLNHTVTQYTNVILRIEKVNTTSLNVFIIDNVVGKGKIAALQGYDTKGRITSNDLGTYNYPTSGKIYQNSSVDLSPKDLSYYQSRPTQAVTYNAFNSPYQIEDTDVEKVSFNYNDNNDRSTIFYGGVQDKLLRPYRKHYSGDGTMEIKENKTTGAVEFITYIGGDAYSAPVVFKSDGGTNQNYLYLHRDYQGSIVAISNQAGAIVEKRLFDPWGNIIKVLDGAGNTLTGLTLLDRGYTGHEHLQSVGIIHMNGRLYDSKLRRFIQADNNIQDPFNTQNYNRYGYVLNNPLKYTDASGEFWEQLFGYLFTAYVSGAYASGGELNPAKWNSSAIVNIGARGLSFGASTVATNFTNNYLDNYNRPPELGISATAGGTADLHPYVSNESSSSSRYNNQALKYAGIATAALAADDATIIGVVDDVLIPVVAGIGTGVWLLNNREVIVDDAREIVDAIHRSFEPDGFHYVTYTKTSLDGSKVYVGRSSGYGTPEQIVKNRDANHHIQGYGAAELTSSLPATVAGGYNSRIGDPSYWSIRGSEQLQIEYWNTRGMSGNSIWGIGINNGSSLKFIEYGLRLLFE